MVISGWSDMVNYDGGFMDFLEKPYSLNSLRCRVSWAIERQNEAEKLLRREIAENDELTPDARVERDKIVAALRDLLYAGKPLTFHKDEE